VNKNDISLLRFSPHTSDREITEQHEISTDASCWITLRLGKVIGFCWGYPISPTELERKLDISVVDAIKEHFGEVNFVAYQDELGVIETERNRKIARQLFEKRLEDFEAQKLEIGIVRTRELPEASVTYKWFTEKLGYHVLARYPDGDGRVVLGQGLDEVRRRLKKESVMNKWDVLSEAMYAENRDDEVFLKERITPERLREAYGRNRAVIIEQGDRIVGIGALWETDHPQWLELGSFFVPRDMRGGGIGSRIYRQRLELVPGGMRCFTVTHNPKAVQLAKRHGFSSLTVRRLDN